MLDWGPLEGVIEGEVALPGSPAYEASRRPFNAQFHEVAPAGIVSCATPQDISEAISFARRHGLEVAMRSGGLGILGRKRQEIRLGESTPHGPLFRLTTTFARGRGPCRRSGQVHRGRQRLRPRE